MPPDGEKYYEFKFMPKEEFDFFKFVNDTSKKLGRTHGMRRNGKGLEIYAEFYKPDNYLGKYTWNSWVDSIRKIIQSGPCTILITDCGHKTIVRNQDDEKLFDPVIGFLMVLIKYMFDKKIYTDLVENIFMMRSTSNESNRMAIIGECEAVLISKIGAKNLNQLTKKFYEDLYEEEI